MWVFLKKKEILFLIIKLDLPLNDWQKNKHAENDFCKDLFLNCEEKIERRNCEDLTLEEFVEIYEKGNKPLVIKNITKKFFKESQWTYEVISIY